MKNNPLKDKSYGFAIRIVKLSQYLQRDKKEFVLSKQVLRSGTAIAALIREAEFEIYHFSLLIFNSYAIVRNESPC